MNLPNKLTLSRIILVPFFVASLLINFPFHTAVALVIFVAATFTDMFDGKIARSRGLVTDFGKFADPLADKILVLSALLCFVQTGLVRLHRSYYRTFQRIFSNLYPPYCRFKRQSRCRKYFRQNQNRNPACSYYCHTVNAVFN